MKVSHILVINATIKQEGGTNYYYISDPCIKVLNILVINVALMLHRDLI